MGRRLRVRNPRTGAIDEEVEEPAPADLARIAEALRSAQPRWSAQSLGARAEVLTAWSESLKRHRESIVDALVRDTGRRYESELEVDGVLGSIRRWCSLARDLLGEEPRRSTSAPFISLEQANEPYPLVGVISPWNFPLLLSLIDAIPALLAGCAVLIKPSEITPRFIRPVMASVADVPGLAGVLAYVAGGPETGEALIHQVDAVCFTGSIPTGRKVAAAAAARLIPAYLELGGKDPAVVLESADVDRAASALLWASTANAGQSCQSIERIYVAEASFPEFVDRLVDGAERLPLAYPEPESGVIGPIIADRQIRVITDHLEDAGKRGAVTRCGGELEELGGGTYLRPTVLTEVDHTMKVMTEETFGPIMPVMPFATREQAIEMANATEYGLSAAVFGAPEEALSVASRIGAGAVSINDAALTAVVHDGEKNAFNRSGLGGTRMGPGSVRRFVRRRAFLIKHGTEPDPWWFPT